MPPLSRLPLLRTLCLPVLALACLASAAVAQTERVDVTTTELSATSTRVNWQPVERGTCEAAVTYNVYKGTSETFEPSASTRVASTAATTYLGRDRADQSSYYSVLAVHHPLASCANATPMPAANIPTLDEVTFEEHELIDGKCASSLNYNNCTRAQLTTLAGTPKPDLTTLYFAELIVLKNGCATSKAIGVAQYRSCINHQLHESPALDDTERKALMTQYVGTGCSPNNLIEYRMCVKEHVKASSATASGVVDTGYRPSPNSANLVPGTVIPSPGTATTTGDGYGDISKVTGLPKTTHVNGYTKKDGTVVSGYYRSHK